MNEIKDSTIGERIKLLRKKRGYNQKELANLLGKSLRTIQKYESGEIEVSIAMINSFQNLHQQQLRVLPAGNALPNLLLQTAALEAECLIFQSG